MDGLVQSEEYQSLFDDDFIEDDDEPEISAFCNARRGVKQDCDPAVMTPIKKNHACVTCGMDMVYTESSECYKCPKCGREKKVYGTTEDVNSDNYNTNPGAPIPLEFEGANSHIYNRSLVINSKSSSAIREGKAIETIQLFVQRYNKEYGVKNASIPHDVCMSAARFFNDAQQHIKTHRGNIRLKIMAACVEIKCFESGIARTSAEISQIFGLRDGYSMGINTLQRLNALKLIDLPEEYNDTVPQYLGRYFEALNINEQYKKFVSEILKLSDSDSSETSFKIKSKIAGCILLLSQQEKLDISNAKISQECGVEFDTYKKFCDIVMKSWKYRKIFKENGIAFKRTI